MQTAKQKLKRAAPWLFLLLVLAGLAAVRGLAANYEIGYEIMNGDFQNYNPVRHLLAGQVPYRDFTVYLGAGELYSVGGLLLVLGNSFGRSMFATNFCTWFYFELLVLAVCLVVIGTARAARAAALALCSVFFAYVQGANLPFAGQVNTLLSYAAANGQQRPHDALSRFNTGGTGHPAGTAFLAAGYKQAAVGPGGAGALCRRLFCALEQ